MACPISDLKLKYTRRKMCKNFEKALLIMYSVNFLEHYGYSIQHYEHDAFQKRC